MKRHDLEARIADLVDEAITLGKHPHHWSFQRIQARRQVIREILEAIDDWDNGRGSATLPNIVNAGPPLSEDEVKALKERAKGTGRACFASNGQGLTVEDLSYGVRALTRGYGTGPVPYQGASEPKSASVLRELMQALSSIEGILGIGWEEEGQDILVWIVAGVPRDQVSLAVYDTQLAFERKYSDINWTFHLLATDDPEVVDVGADESPLNEKGDGAE
ncbi:MAG: hypothetical protein ACTSPX_03385 [Candidatus Thorarchaeota archaeon]